MASFTAISECRLCGYGDVVDFFELGEQALSGVFPKLNEPDPIAVPLTLCRCASCGLVQLRHSTNPEDMFTHDYGYRSNLNAAMAQHLKDLVTWSATRANLQKGDNVLDIGCNDGTLLGAYKDRGVDRFGIDPIVHKFSADYPEDITVHEGFFTAETGKKVLSGRKMKIITSIAMFYDLPDPDDFVKGIQNALADDGLWVFEQSYLVNMLQDNAFDSICHEHIEYWALAQIEPLLHRNGLKLYDGEINDTNGGSFRLAACHANSDYSETDAIKEMRTHENEMALDTWIPYDDFKQRIFALSNETRALIEKLNAEGKRIYAYGASTKGNTLLQFYGLDHRQIIAAVEVNPEKYGHCTPGSRIPIIPEEDCLDEGIDYFLVLPWHFRANILSRAQKYRDRGVKFIFPLPHLEIVE